MTINIIREKATVRELIKRETRVGLVECPPVGSECEVSGANSDYNNVWQHTPRGNR
jgi:hypothetical protein